MRAQAYFDGDTDSLMPITNDTLLRYSWFAIDAFQRHDRRARDEQMYDAHFGPELGNRYFVIYIISRK